MGCDNCDNKCKECSCKSNTVLYTGADLDCLGVKNGDTLDSVLSKIDAFVCSIDGLNAEVCSETVLYCGTGISCGTDVLATNGDTLDAILLTICSLLPTAGVKTFNLIPNKATELNATTRRMELSTATATGSGQAIFGDQPFMFEVDRIGCIEDITVQFTDLPVGLTNTNILIIDSEDNDLYFTLVLDFSWTSLALGDYDFNLEFSTPTCGTKTFPYRLTIIA